MIDVTSSSSSPGEAEQLRSRIAELEHRLFEQEADAAILAKLRLDEARYRAIVEDQSEFIVRCTLDGTRTFVNDAYCRFAGKPREALLGQSFYDGVPDEDQAAIRAKLASLTPQIPSAVDQHRTMMPDGSIRWQEWTDRALFGPSGTLIEIQSVGRDITKRKHAELALAASEERLQLAIDAVGDGAYDWNIVTGEVYVSDRWLEMMGYSREETLPGIDFWRGILHPEDRPRLVAALTSHFEGRFVDYECEYRLLTKSGDYRWVRDRGQVILRDPEGKPQRMVGTDSNITLRKQAEEKLQHLELQLAHVARLSTMGELVAGIAHEVNQPLYAILNFAKACRNLLATSDQPDLELLREWTSEIASASTRAGEIIKRLSGFVRNKEVEHKPDDINAIVRETNDFMIFEARRHHIEVTLQLASSLPPVSVDRVQIQQVIVNLLKNAFDAVNEMHADRPKVQMSTRQSGEIVEVVVDDSGPGLPADPQIDIFHPFTSTKATGMGMGLAIARGIVEAHGGTLRAINRPEGGAEFIVGLPVVK